MNTVQLYPQNSKALHWLKNTISTFYNLRLAIIVFTSRDGLKGRGARGNFHWRAPMTYFITSSFGRFVFADSLRSRLLFPVVNYVPTEFTRFTHQTPVVWKLAQPQNAGTRYIRGRRTIYSYFKCQPLSAGSYVFRYKVRTFRTSL